MGTLPLSVAQTSSIFPFYLFGWLKCRRGGERLTGSVQSPAASAPVAFGPHVQPRPTPRASQTWTTAVTKSPNGQVRLAMAPHHCEQQVYLSTDDMAPPRPRYPSYSSSETPFPPMTSTSPASTATIHCHRSRSEQAGQLTSSCDSQDRTQALQKAPIRLGHQEHNQLDPQ